MPLLTVIGENLVPSSAAPQKSDVSETSDFYPLLADTLEITPYTIQC
jgi:hypothetical protein